MGGLLHLVQRGGDWAGPVSHNLVTSDKGGGKCVCPRLSVCLCVICLLVRLLKNACMDLDEMLRVDRCWDMMN